MRIPRPRGITRGQIAFVTVIGVFSGVYIWKPLLIEKYPNLHKKTKSETTEGSISQ